MRRFLLLLWFFLLLALPAHAQKAHLCDGIWCKEGHFLGLRISGTTNISGTLNATAFVGDGSGLTNVTTSSISLTTVSVTNISATVADIRTMRATQTSTTNLSATVADITTLRAGTLSGNGAGLSGVIAAGVSYYNVSNVPTRLQAVSSGTPIDLSGLTISSAGTISGAALISTSVGGVVSGTYGYFKYVSGTLAGDCTLCTNVTAAGVSWSGITGIPTGVQNVSNGTGSVTATVLAATQVTTTNVSASLVDATRSGTVSATYGYFGNISGSGAGITGVVASSVDWYSVLRVPGAVAAVSNNGIVSLTGISTTSNQASFTTVFASGITTLASGSNIIGGLAVSNTAHALAIKQTADGSSGGLSLERPSGGTTFGEVWEDSNGLNLRTNSQNNNKLIVDAAGVGLGIGVVPNARLDVLGNISASNVYVTGTTGTVSAVYGYFTNISGSGAGIGNVTAVAAPWNGITGVPAGLANVSNSTGGITLTTVTAGLVSATTTSGTYGYFKYVSGTFAGDGSGLTNVAASSLPWVSITSVPAGLTNISNSTGSVTATLFSGNTSGTSVNAQFISGTLYGINNSVTASSSEVLYVSGTRIDGALGLCYNNVSNSVFIGTPTGVGCPASPSSTLQVSGTFIASGLATLTNVSATGGISVTGNLSANKLIGDCSLCTGISAGGTPDSIVSQTSSIKVISATTTISATVASENVFNLTSQTAVVSGTLTVTRSISATNALRAWVKFSGNTGLTSKTAIFNQFNINTVSRTSAGLYAISFTVPMLNANYGIWCNSGHPNNTSTPKTYGQSDSPSPTTTGFVVTGGSSSGGQADFGDISCQVTD